MNLRVPAALMGLALLAGACAPSAPAPTQPAQPGGASAPQQEKRATDQVLRIGRPGFPTSASPESSSANGQIFGAQFDTLTSFDKDLTLKPWVAERWEFLPNDEGWRFFLRKDLTFSNGDALTSADLDFSVKMLLEVSPPLPQRGLLPKLNGSRVVDQFTVDLLTAGRDSSLLSGTPYLYLFPKKYYEQVGKNEFATKPIGSGPYVITEFKTADSIKYKLRTDKPHPFRKPIATEVHWRAIPENTALYNGMRTGDLDLIWTGPGPDQAETAKRDGFQVFTGEQASQLIAIDKATNERLGTPLVDKRVRQALNYAIDRDTLSKTLYRGFAASLNQIAIPETPAFATDIPKIPFDQAQAKRLLSEAGYPNGFKIQNPIDFIQTPSNAQFVQAIQDYWRQIGVDVQLNGLELGIWVDKFYARNNQSRNELITSGGADPTGNLLFFRQFVTCNNPPARVIWCVPEFDRLMDQAYAEPDQRKSADLVRQAVKAHTAEWSYIFVLAVPQYVFASPKLRGVQITPQTFWITDGVYKVE